MVHRAGGYRPQFDEWKEPAEQWSAQWSGQWSAQWSAQWSK
jgi:hypothetical protein